MNELFVIDIPEENYTTIAAGQGKKEAIEVDDGDDALMLEDLDVKDKSIEGEEVEPEMLPLPEPRYRSYFETDENNPSGEYRPVEEYATTPRLPIVLTSATKYLKWTILTPSRVQSAHYDVVLGISTKRLNLDTVEAIIITVQYYPSRYTSAAKSEVINPQELRRLCSIETENDDICFRWKLHEKLVLFTDAQPITFAVEVKTWQDQPLDYGSIEFHYSEILTDSVAYYKDGELKLLQLWRFEEPQSVESQRSGQESDYPCQSHRSAGSLPNDTFQPYLVAWMQLPMADDYECCLSWDATQFAYVNLTRLYDPLNVMLDITNYTSFYKVDANYTQVPAGAIAGRGFRKFSVE
ncbi:hypothetical protein BGZ97_008771 [Linnemannia gamsii]|uniref:Uncharacterized protein n=1 Tax=Linnemannia gamsii TaxID=64522 RepID=A0A9P6RDG3_9FUNG|nr:hypothetical protein BGZ97_008771 [Linnemannia gamsii]